MWGAAFTGAGQHPAMDAIYDTLPVWEALIEQNSHVDRMQAVALAMEGLILVNGHPARHPNQRVRPADEVAIAG